MNHSAEWGWLTLFLLGAYHGINPAMGWLFAVAVGMQQNSAQVVVRSLWPIALGHALAIGLAILLAGLIQIVLPRQYLKFTIALGLLGLGIYKLVRSRHVRGGGMKVGFRELTFWSFLVASAHGAGLMVLPVVLGLSAVPAEHQMHMGSFRNPLTGTLATVVHTGGYLASTAAIALVIYKKLGLALLRRAWINFDLIWAVALIVTGCFAFML
jgi:hypothetical protein